MLGAIRRHLEEYGQPPTVRELMGYVGIKSPNGILCHLKPLAKKGYISVEEFSARGIRLLTAGPIPSFGATATAGGVVLRVGAFSWVLTGEQAADLAGQLKGEG